VGWVACSAKALYLQIDHPLMGEDLVTDSVDYLKVREGSIYLVGTLLTC
jgi:MOSC domain-containing protein YiiM